MTLFVWTREPQHQSTLRSDLNFAIFDAFARRLFYDIYVVQQIKLSTQSPLPGLLRTDPAERWLRSSGIRPSHAGAAGD